MFFGRVRLGEWEQQAAGRYSFAFLALASATALLAPFRHALSLLSIGLLYLLNVAVIAACWGRGPSLFASLLANLGLNFFFLRPYYRFTVDQADNAVALLVFLGVAILTSSLVARARSDEAAAREREQETAILYDLSRLIIGNLASSAILAAICRQVQTTFAAESCAVLLAQDGRLVPTASAGLLDNDIATVDEWLAAEQAISNVSIIPLGERPGRRGPRIIGNRGRTRPVVYVPLQVGGRVVGVLRVAGKLSARVFTDDELRLLEAFADQAALAADRDQLLLEAARAEALQETDQLKSALLSAVSHDLRTPLAAIKTSVSSLLSPDIDWEAATRRQLLSAIDEETDRLTRLVNNLLDLSRIEGGAMRSERDWYDLNELVETVLSRLGQTVARHHLVVDIAPDVGDVSLDYIQIGQVLTNLIENATKYAPEDTEIRVSARRIDSQVEISVTDMGLGVSPAEREKVFEKFYRIEQARKLTPGAGLGLSICQGLVEAHGGHIWVEGESGGGERFVFTLPAPLSGVSKHAEAMLEAS